MTRAILVVAAYIAAQILADIGSLKIVLFLGLSMDAGTFIYPITFTLRDLAHKTLGIKEVRVLILAAAFINLVMAVFFLFVSNLPGDPEVGSQAEFAAVLSPVWRIVIASIIAEVISEFVDTEVYQFWVKRVTKLHQWSRVLVSNIVSVPLDSLLFSVLAFFGDLPVATVWSIFIANVLVKGATTLFSMPLIYAVPDQHRHEANAQIVH